MSAPFLFVPLLPVQPLSPEIASKVMNHGSSVGIAPAAGQRVLDP